MSRAATVLHLTVGVIALLLGSLALVESIRSARLAAHRRFGLALGALGMTTAAHYLVAGVTFSEASRQSAGPRVAALLLALLPVAVFFWLRVEAYLDGPGDRFLDGKPAWISLLPSVAAACAGAVLVTAWMSPPPAQAGSGDLALRWLGVLPTILLVGTSLGIGWSLMRGQQTRNAVLGGWSLSGLAVTLIFPTSAVSYAVQVLTLRPTLVGSIVDWAGVPAAIWFWREIAKLTGSGEKFAHRRLITVTTTRAKRPAPWATIDPD